MTASAVARFRALANGERTEADRRWLLGPSGAVAVARAVARGDADAASLGDLTEIGLWLDDSSFARERTPGDRLRSLIAIARIADHDPERDDRHALRELLETVAAGYRCPVDEFSLRTVGSETAIDVVLRDAVAVGATELEHVIRVVHGRIRSARRRAVSVAVPVSAHHAGEMMTLHVARVAGPPGVIIDRAAAPFLDCDDAFESALDRAHRALRCGFAIRWHIEFERSGRPVEWITGGSCGLAAAVAFWSLATESVIARDLAFTGIVSLDGSIVSLVNDGRHDYDAKVEISGGRRLVVPAADGPLVAAAAERRTRGPAVLGVSELSELSTLLEVDRRVPTIASYPRAPSTVLDSSAPIGRREEVAFVEGIIDRTCGPRMVVVSGRSGIGKSVLVDFLASAIDARVCVRVDGGDRVHEGAITRFVESLSSEALGTRPAVLVLDDAHLARDPDVQVLGDLVMSDATIDVVVLIAGLDVPDAAIGRRHLETGDVPRGTAFRALLDAAAASHPNVVGLELRPLDASAIETIVADEFARRGADLVTGLAGRIADIASGDPLVASLLVDLAVRDRGAIADASGDRSRDLASQLVAGALRALAVPDVVEAAAVFGEDVEAAGLLAVTRLAPEVFWEVVAASVASGLLRESDGPIRYRCAHSLIEEAVRAELSTSRRNQLHRRVATYFENREDTPRRSERLATHFCAIDPPELDPRALDFALRAASDAETDRDFDAACHWYERGMSMAAKVAEFDVLIGAQVGLGRALRRRGGAHARRVLLTAARRAAELRRSDLLVEAVLAAHRGFFSSAGRVDNEWIDLLESALAVVGDDRVARADLLAVLAAELTWQPDPAHRRGLADDALVLALESGNLAAIARVRYRRSLAIARADSVAERDRNAFELQIVAQRLGDGETRFAAAITRATVAAEVARMDEALIAVHDAEVLAEGLRDRGPLFSARLARAGSLLTQGVLDGAAVVSDEALAIGLATDAADAAMLHGEQTWEIERLRGDDRSRSLAVAVSTVSDPALATFGARYAYESGAVAEARSAYDRLRNDPDSTIVPGLTETAVERDLAVLARRFGDSTMAETLAPRLQAQVDHFANTTIVRPSGRHALGLVAATMGRVDLVDHWFESAVDLHLDVRAPLLAAESLIEWADALIDSGEAQRAIALLDRAEELSVPRDAGGLVRRSASSRSRATA